MVGRPLTAPEGNETELPDPLNPPKGCKFSPRCPYVQPKCVEEDPPLVDAAEPGHAFRCWIPVGTPESRAAIEANRAAGIAQATGAVVS